MIYASGVDEGVNGIKVDYYFGFDHLHRGKHTILRTYLDREDPEVESVTQITPQADWSERELIEFLGVKAKGHPDPRHLWLPLNWEKLRLTDEESKAEAAKFKQEPVDNILNLPVTVVPYGPYHPAFIESNYFKMAVEDEVVKTADLKLGFNHRSVIKLMERRDYYKDVYLAERICGFCNAHQSITFAMTAECIGNVEIPPRAGLIRTLLFELERIQSHLLAIGLVGDLMGFKTMFMHCLRIREDIQDCLELISGQRVTHGLGTLGGVRRDITACQADFVLSKIKAVKKSSDELFDQVLANDVLLTRLEGVGKLSHDDAIMLGAVGPTARGSNWKIDVRKNSPYAAYENLDWEIITETDGDCLARLKVKMREVLMALHIIEQCCEKLKSTSGSIVAAVSKMPCAEAISKSEAPRGELLYHVSSDGTNTPEYVRIRTPTFRVAHIMLKLIHGVYVGDVPAIIGSIDPCYSCTDRVTVIRGGKGESVEIRSLGENK
ncbi:iron hydrogenase [Methanocella sp. CWC-04]|uniref:Iron hydrogenase n=2 Tax=Methanooceanicella nereidis TaxID=2052831 RepID=A0AAP2W721_9EURY|nr:iron hydrogenase [Methanocella sp. CWC-04]